MAQQPQGCPVWERASDFQALEGAQEDPGWARKPPGWLSEGAGGVMSVLTERGWREGLERAGSSPPCNPRLSLRLYPEQASAVGTPALAARGARSVHTLDLES